MSPSSLDLSQEFYTITVRDYEPFIIIHTNETTGERTYSGICVEIVQALATAFNFTYKLVEPPDNQFGTLWKNGSGWTGMIGTVMRREATIAASGITITHSRSQVVDFLTPFWEVGSTFIVRVSTENKLTRMFKPFSWQVWLSLVSAVLVSAFILMVFTRLSSHTQHGMLLSSKSSLEHLIKELLESLEIAIRPLQRQGWFSLPRSLSASAYSLAWVFTCIIITATFSSNLIALLSVTILDLPVEYIEDILERPNFKAGTKEGNSVTQQLREAPPDSNLGKLWARVLASDGVVPINDKHALSYDRVVSEDFAYINDDVGMMIRSQKNCSFVVGKERFLKSYFGFAVAKDFTHTEAFNKQILYFLEMGLIKTWAKKHWPKGSDCDHQKLTTNAMAVSLADISGSVMLLGVGVVLSLIVLSLERLIHNGHYLHLCNQ